MTIRVPLLVILLCFPVGNRVMFAQPQEAAAARRITLSEALQLAQEHNHVVRIARSSVEEKQHVKEVARSAYFPWVRNETSYVRVTDTQLIEIPAGGLGSVGSAPIPPSPLIINQGGLSLTTSGTGITQPLTQLLKIRAANDIAQAEVDATRSKSRGTENTIALKVHQLYYQILIGEARRIAVQAKIQATEDVQSERVAQVKYGSALDADLIESRAQSLQARQELLTTDLQLSDLRMQFNDVIGLPLTTAVTLEPALATAAESCAREECLKLALESHPEIAEARATVEKAASAVRLAKYEFVPDVEVFARYSFQDNVPFLARNFATYGVRMTYDLFDGGRKRAAVRLRDAQLAQAKENLARLVDEVELRVQTAYNKLDRTRQMVAVSKELLALREESRRVAAEQLVRGSALRSQAKTSVAQELEARALLLQSQLDYLQAADEMDEAIGRRPQ
jgi:outer membrane protein